MSDFKWFVLSGTVITSLEKGESMTFFFKYFVHITVFSFFLLVLLESYGL